MLFKEVNAQICKERIKEQTPPPPSSVLDFYLFFRFGNILSWFLLLLGWSASCWLPVRSSGGLVFSLNLKFNIFMKNII